MSAVGPIVLGAIIGIAGSFGAAFFIAATTRLQKEREIHSDVRQKVRRIRGFVTNFNPLSLYADREADALEIAYDLDAASFAFAHSVDRRDVRVCATAIVERQTYGLDENAIALNALAVLDAIVEARSEQRHPILQNAKLPEWAKRTLREFRSAEEDQEENARMIAEQQQREWEERRKKS